MSKCEGGRRVDAWHDGQMNAQERQAMEAHLRECPDCAREAEEARRMSRFMASARLPGLPPGGRERLMRLGGRRAEFTLVRLSEYVMAAAAMVLACCVGWLAVSGERSAATERTPSLWESAAVTPRTEALSANETESYMARWIVADLGRGSDRE